VQLPVLGNREVPCSQTSPNESNPFIFPLTNWSKTVDGITRLSNPFQPHIRDGTAPPSSPLARPAHRRIRSVLLDGPRLDSDRLGKTTFQPTLPRSTPPMRFQASPGESSVTRFSHNRTCLRQRQPPDLPPRSLMLILYCKSVDVVACSSSTHCTGSLRPHEARSASALAAS